MKPLFNKNDAVSIAGYHEVKGVKIIKDKFYYLLEVNGKFLLLPEGLLVKAPEEGDFR